jgi:hypothetical protein
MTLYIDTRPALEWVEYNGQYMADGYEVGQVVSIGKWYGWYNEQGINRRYHDTLDQAKAAAQADYEARTADRFRAVELPPYLPEDNTASLECEYGWNSCVDALMEAILVAHNPRSRGIIDSVTKATLPESLHTKP